MTERDLAELAAKRDREAFAQLYDRYVDRVYKYIYFKCRRTEEAEDLTAQVFMKAWEAIDRYRWEGFPFSTWLFRIAHNQLVDHYRTDHPTASLDVARAIHRGPDLFEVVQNKMTGEEIRAALKHLSEPQQRVLILRFIEGYSVSEIADIMEKDPAAIRAIQHRALRSLQPHIDPSRAVRRSSRRQAAAADS